MSDTDLIRRGDALDAMLTGPRTVQERIDLIRALPAAQPAPDAETIRQLRAELQSVLEREAVTHARNDARVEALEAQIDAMTTLAAALAAPVTVEKAARVLLDDSGHIGQMMRKIVALAGVATEDFPDRCALPIVTNASPTMGEARALRALAGEKPNE
jgi:hypothetical protein